MPDEASAIITGLLALSTLCAARVGIPQFVLLFRKGAKADGLHPFRVMWVLLMGALAVGTGWRCLVWADLTFADQHWFGPIAERWPVDMAITMMIFAACLFAAVLYEITQRSES